LACEDYSGAACGMVNEADTIGWKNMDRSLSTNSDILMNLIKFKEDYSTIGIGIM
jgi:hypothetical protein